MLLSFFIIKQTAKKRIHDVTSCKIMNRKITQQCKLYEHSILLYINT